MNPSSNSNELRDFLLDRLPPEQAEAIEARMFQDDELFSDLQDAEDELIEEYATGEMNPAEAKVFGARIERDADLRERVAVRRVLIRTLQMTSSRAVLAAAPVHRRALWGRFLVPGFALAILILFLLSYRAEHRSLPSQAANAPAAPTQPPAGSRQDAVSQAAAVLFLPAHVARGIAQQQSVLHLGNAAVVKLELETPSADAAVRWDVRIADGGTVFSATGLKSQQAGVVSYVVAEVPVAQLPPKTYAVTLSPEGNPEEAVTTSWDFQVVQ